MECVAKLCVFLCVFLHFTPMNVVVDTFVGFFHIVTEDIN